MADSVYDSNFAVTPFFLRVKEELINFKCVNKLLDDREKPKENITISPISFSSITIRYYCKRRSRLFLANTSKLEIR